MVSGKPYISVKSATRKAEKAPKERQSRFVRGRAKLRAKRMKMAELIRTRIHSPYAGAAGVMAAPPPPSTGGRPAPGGSPAAGRPHPSRSARRGAPYLDE